MPSPLLIAAVFGLISVDDPALVLKEHIAAEMPTPSCHASTIAEGSDGLIAAWFGGKKEGSDDVTIWVARHEGGRWTDPVSVADGVQAEGRRFPCWNPVLDVEPSGRVVLYYKVGPSPSEWWGEWKSSTDGGRTWSGATKLPDGFLGPVKNKAIRLDDGTLLCPSSTETDPGDRWAIHIERTNGPEGPWAKSASQGGQPDLGLIQPTILVHRDGRLQSLSRSRQHQVYSSFSTDQGRTWDDPVPTPLPNPNSGIDAVTLKDGRHLVIYNHTPKGRSPLNVAVSTDGKSWQSGPVLEDEPGEFSYPAVVQARDGKVHVTYTDRRLKVRHVVLDPAKIVPRPLP